jgi:hypothetical protein
MTNKAIFLNPMLMNGIIFCRLNFFISDFSPKERLNSHQGLSSLGCMGATRGVMEAARGGAMEYQAPPYFPPPFSQQTADMFTSHCSSLAEPYCNPIHFQSSQVIGCKEGYAPFLIANSRPSFSQQTAIPSYKYRRQLVEKKNTHCFHSQ